MSPTPSSLPAPHIGYLFLAASAFLLAVGAHAILFSALFSSRDLPGGGGGTGRPTMIDIMTAGLDAVARDTHYKYLALFSVPVCAYFVIANWRLSNAVHNYGLAEKK